MYMTKIKENIKLTNIEILFIIVMLAVAIIGGIAIFSSSTKARKLTNFKEDTNNLIKAAKASYASFSKRELTSIFATSSDGTTKGMCITIQGLKANDFLTKEYKDWDGYIVIEESSKESFNYSIWMTDQKYVINGYDASKLEDLDLDKGITLYNDETFTTKVRQNFTGTSSKNGGTGSIDGSNLKQYETRCINEKVE